MARQAEETYIYRRGASPNTRVAISQKNRVFSIPYGSTAFKQVGVLSTFDYNESRAVDPVRGVGFGDKIQELVPGVTEPMTVTLNRTLLYTSSLAQELGYRGGVDGLVRSLRHHKWPFDLKSELVFSELVTNYDDAHYQGGLGSGGVKSDEVGNFALVTFFEACWLNSISISFPSDSAIVMEDCSATATDVTDGTARYELNSDNYGDVMESGNNPFLGAGSNLFPR